jgi:heme/copper-type cytochrome/quinol oxidase subunit 2
MMMMMMMMVVVVVVVVVVVMVDGDDDDDDDDDDNSRGHVQLEHLQESTSPILNDCFLLCVCIWKVAFLGLVKYLCCSAG